MGDFFETFEEDAKIAAKTLGITLTKRSNGAAGEVPLAGFPHHALESYLPKLVRAGYRAAICEQLEDPKQAKGVVKRDVIEVVTPGVAFSDKLLDHKRNNYLAAAYFKGDRAGLAFCDVSTGEFAASETSAEEFGDLLQSVAPREILAMKKQFPEIERRLRAEEDPPRLTKTDEWSFDYDFAVESLAEQFEVATLKGFGVEDMREGLIAAGAALNYLRETQKANLSHLRKIVAHRPSDFMALDRSTRRNMEILASMRDGGREGSLVSVMDKTETPMGGRLFKLWLYSPLKRLDRVLARQRAVAELVERNADRDALVETLREIGDMERLVARVCTGRANPRELTNLRASLARMPELKEALAEANAETLVEIRDGLDPLEEIGGKINEAIVDYPPANLADGGVIRKGYSVELDELRDIAFSGRDWIANLQKTERERTDVPSLKIGFNKVFGYYIEVSNAHKSKVPENYIRKQTLVNAERYITPELKEFEERALNAEASAADLEARLFDDVRQFAASAAERIQNNARFVATLDCFVSLARVAVDYDYVRPEIDEGTTIDIKDGRHPVVERILPPEATFAPNSTTLDNDDAQIVVLTGPNMAGKSVYLRQVGLIALLAQVGSFVPAASARVGLVDRVFTRVGASDNIAAGESTFLVEMQEAANILNNATPKSLILLDEIGRGTSTYDGVSIAWAIVEYLHENPEAAAKTLFATHYHELNELAELYPRVRNFKVEVREIDDRIVFLHKVSAGKADHSYGIQVAQMAGLPSSVTKRAKDVLMTLEGKEVTPSEERRKRIKKREILDGVQLDLFEARDDEFRKELTSLELDRLTPLDALNKLNELKKKATDS
jgi:DNA mismatch repair protein MutS